MLTGITEKRAGVYVHVCVCVYGCVSVSVPVGQSVCLCMFVMIGFLGHSISLHTLTNNAHTYQVNSFMFPCM